MSIKIYILNDLFFFYFLYNDPLDFNSLKIGPLVTLNCSLLLYINIVSKLNFTSNSNFYFDPYFLTQIFVLVFDLTEYDILKILNHIGNWAINNTEKFEIFKKHLTTVFYCNRI